ncbi:hypothetical protein CH333_03850 [candidate division WOR-3 bacterium JGI_Cruoil_03_44_89]|uniref:Ancillary SecYEG translocon subunit/Cell division coordinator CpoB TPR domain-containing protein n=1 Tax=candidate division WOR-3 bacterium JGI_Cruoil_03_44_89 TaxID=1973748 RepID=A0A235BV84_UNCW3|nr:MAG: hypothetical protein CH333_03850 [candidate division WOR-3 bacterium JGI_Cruoil_03_44_89]
MAKRRKITKKDLKQDRFLETGLKAFRFTKQHRNIAIGTAIGVIFILIAIPLYQDYRRSGNEEADNQMMQAELAYLKGDFQNAYMQFETIHSNYRKTTAGAKAVYFMAHLLELQGKPDEAIKYFEEFLTMPEDNILTPAALLGLGACKTQLGKLDEAIKSFEETITRFPDSYFAQEAYQRTAELKEAMGDVDGAMEVYKKICNKYPRTDFAKQAEEKMAFLEGMSAVTRVKIPSGLQILPESE